MRSLSRPVLLLVIALTAATANAQRLPRQMPAKTLHDRSVVTPSPQKRLFDPNSVLVRFKSGTTADLKAQARSATGGRLLRAYSLVPGLEQVSIGAGVDVASALAILRRLPFVAYAQRNDVIFATGIPNDEYFDEQWALHNWGQDSMFGVWLGGTPDADVDGPEAWDTTTSSDAIVAILDTGITWSHPDLDANIWTNSGEIPGNGIDDDGNGLVDDVRGWDFVNNDNNPDDDHGHGSHVAGIVGAEGNNGIGVSGILWSARLMAVKVIAADGTGLLSDAVAGLEYAVAKGAKVANASWGYYTYPGEEEAHQALYDAIAAAQASNLLFVTAAGNDTLNTDLPGNTFYPAGFNLDNIISVAATDNNDELAFFSNYGPTSVDIGAPGVDVFSTWNYHCVFIFCDYDYAWESGTSMSSPHVAGVAALVYGRHPNWTYGQVRDRVFSSARPIAALQGMTVTGGVVNAAAALVESAPPPAAPTNLQATPTAYNHIDLSWTDNSGDEDGFQIERSTDGVNWSPLATVSANITTYPDITVAAQTTYYYRVRATNVNGASPYSNIATATTPAAPAPPAAPTNLQAIATAYNRIDLTWTDNSGNEDGFQIERSTDGVNWSPLATVGANITTYPDGTVAAQTTYYYRTRATNVNGASPYSNIATATTPAAPAPPAAPTNLQATLTAYNRIDLAWIDNATDETGFQIERSTDGVNWSPLATVGANITTYPDVTVAAQTTYSYRVRATNANGPSPYSNTASATTPAVDLAVSDIAVAGSVTGSYVNTQADDGVVESITEVLSAGGSGKRYSYLEHKWTFNLGAGGNQMFFANAFENPISAEDDFKLQWSVSDVTYVDLCVIGVNCGAGKLLMPGLTGTLYLRVVDTNHTPGTQLLDTVQIDSMRIEATALPHPINLTATARNNGKRVDLTWNSATTPTVDIWRNGAVMVTTPNSGAYSDMPGVRGSYTYTVCEAGSTTVCSVARSVTF